MQRLVDSARSTAHGEIQFIWFIDEDDSESQMKVYELQRLGIAPYMVCEKRGKVLLSEAANLCYKEARADIILLAGDDIVFRTPGWDSTITAEFEKSRDKILLCGGHDGLNKDLITHPILHRNWIDTVGRLAPPYFRDCYVDTWLNEVGRMIGRVRWLPIYIEHMHFSSGKSEYDQTARERMEKIHNFDESYMIFQETRDERIKEAQKLAEFIRNNNVGNT